MGSPLGLFEGFGIEIEYMIVKNGDLSVLPIADEVMKAAAGEIVSDFEDSEITWSNELVAHVIELKTTHPAPSLAQLEDLFWTSSRRISGILKTYDARLMPTAMHPLMNPLTETRLWPHDNNEVYESYDRIFDCRGHGWSNLQSMHINLPFKTDAEFALLHTAIRFLLPLLPALTASSPIVEGKRTGFSDSRLIQYQQNQKRIPSIAGLIVPEAVTSEREYRDKILKPIFNDIAPFDPEELLRDDWLNSRGAIARFGRKTIEIRVLDTQECPAADIAIADFICTALKVMIDGKLFRFERLLEIPTEDLKALFDDVVKNGASAVVRSPQVLSALQYSNQETLTVGQVWESIFERLQPSDFMASEHHKTIERLLSIGALSRRISDRLGSEVTADKIRAVYHELCQCLDQNKFFAR